MPCSFLSNPFWLQYWAMHIRKECEWTLLVMTSMSPKFSRYLYLPIPIQYGQVEISILFWTNQPRDTSTKYIRLEYLGRPGSPLSSSCKRLLGDLQNPLGSLERVLDFDFFTDRPTNRGTNNHWTKA